jgi:hypothetical protein
MAQPVINIGSKLDGKGFKQAETASQKLGKSVKQLGLTFAGTFSAQKLAQYAKNAIKAFAENEKSAKRLETVVKNLGLAFELPGIEASLDEVSAKFGYQGEVLREAFQKLITATGSAKKSQDLLNLSLDIAAASGVDLLTVNQDLAALFVGNTKGLKKYNLGVSQANLTTLTFEEGLALLTKTFKGAGGAELTTYSGKMRILSEAAGNAEEIIGGALVESLTLLAGEGESIQPLADTMADVATYVADATVGLATLLEQIKSIPGGDVLAKFMGTKELLKTVPLIKDIINLLDFFGKYNKFFNPEPLQGRASEHMGRPGNPMEAQRKKAEADRLKLQNKSLDAQKKQNALIKASKILDLDRIGITAALKGKISETDRLSLNLQLALLDKNDEKALKLSAELDAAIKRNKELTGALLATPEAPNPYRNWKPPGFIGPVMPPGITFPKNPDAPPYGEEVPDFNVPDYVKQGAGITGRPAGDYLGLSAIGAGATADTIVNVVVNVDGDPVANAITNSQVNQSLSGTFSDVSRYNGRGAPSIK